jgi:predicted lipoprotein with Yx(FWY)xxD motif
VAAVLSTVALAACGSSSPNPTATASTPTNPSSATAQNITVGTGLSALGTVLTNVAGQTLYYLTSEAGGLDDCTLQPGCAATWPGVRPPSDRTPVGSEAVLGILGVISAADGSLEVTYNGWPLHTLQGEAAGQVAGQAQTSFGGTWYVATPSLAPAIGSQGGSTATFPALTTPPSITPPGGLPADPFAPTTPPAFPTAPPLPTIVSGVPTNPY